MKRIVQSVLLAVLVLIIPSCTEDAAPDPVDNNTKETLTQVGETYLAGASIKAVLYTKKTIETGYNELFVALFDSISGTRIEEGHLEVRPMMDMGSMKHSAPVENCTDSFSTEGYYAVSVVFIMPGTAAQWSANLTYRNTSGTMSGQGSIGVEVKASEPNRCLNTVLPLDNETKVFISLLAPKDPGVGINDLEITMHSRMGMMDFPPIDNYTVEIEPWMPSMGHGSPNNVHPVHEWNGHYQGKVNFTMTGLWHVKLKLYKDGNLISDDQYFEMTLH